MYGQRIIFDTIGKKSVFFSIKIGGKKYVIEILLCYQIGDHLTLHSGESWNPGFAMMWVRGKNNSKNSYTYLTLQSGESWNPGFAMMWGEREE
jgi:hypothetical protein